MTPVTYENRDGVARIRLTDPARGNPITHEMVDALAHAIRRARADEAPVVVLSSDGGAFSVAGDVSLFASADDPEQALDHLAESFHRVISELHAMNAIVVSAVTGAAAGAGLALAAAADLVLASTSAQFTVAYTKLGLSPDGGTSTLSASLGLHRLLQLALLNPVLSAQEAHAAGLVAQVHADAEFAAAVERVVETLRHGSRAVQVATKRLIREATTPGEEAALCREARSIRTRAASADGQEGVAAFVDKRPPVFPGD